MNEVEDLRGMRFGRLVVIEQAPYIIQPSGARVTTWLCRCDCGNTKVARAWCLKSGNVKSCGCYRRELPKTSMYVHGGCVKNDRERLYAVWNMMKQRCNTPNSKAYPNYGGRGIKVCAEWNDSYETFRLWSLANGYDDTLKKGKCTIDRINNDGGYSPDNCRWVSMEGQANNTRHNHFLTFNGETKTIAQWSRVTGIRCGTIQHRIKSGWSVEDILTIKPKIGANKHEQRNRTYTAQ